MSAIFGASDGARTAASNESEDTSKKKSSQNVWAAVGRSLTGTLAFYFKRPVKLFRPVRVSSWTAIQAMANEQGKRVTPKFVRNVLKDQGWKFIPKQVLPPLLANTAVGMTLFTSYTISEALLLSPLSPISSKTYGNFSNPGIPFLCGLYAGSMQSVLSSPLDNARQLIVRQSEFAKSAHGPEIKWKGWTGLMKNAMLPPFIAPALYPISSPYAAIDLPTSLFGRVRLFYQWTTRGWSLFSLSLFRDSLGFGVFFTVFEVGREVARRTGRALDSYLTAPNEIHDTFLQSLHFNILFPAPKNEEEKLERKRIGRTVQAVIIVAAGALAGLAYGLVGRPFDIARGIVWEGWMKYAEDKMRPTSGNAHLRGEHVVRGRGRKGTRTRKGLNLPSTANSEKLQTIRVRTKPLSVARMSTFAFLRHRYGRLPRILMCSHRVARHRTNLSHRILDHARFTASASRRYRTAKLVLPLLKPRKKAEPEKPTPSAPPHPDKVSRRPSLLSSFVRIVSSRVPSALALASGSASTSRPPSFQPSFRYAELPSATSLISDAVRRDGMGSLFGLRSRGKSSKKTSVFSLADHPALGGDTVYLEPGSEDKPAKTQTKPKTRHNVAGKGGSRGMLKGGGGNAVARLGTLAGKFFTYVPPYSIGFLIYAVVSGDLS